MYRRLKRQTTSSLTAAGVGRAAVARFHCNRSLIRRRDRPSCRGVVIRRSEAGARAARNYFQRVTRTIRVPRSVSDAVVLVVRVVIVSLFFSTATGPAKYVHALEGEK